MSSSCRAANTNFLDSLSLAICLYHPFLSAGLHDYIRTELLPVSFCCEGVQRRMSLMSLSLLFQQCPTCLVHLIWMVLEMGGRWPYICCFMGCYFQDLFSIAYSVLVQLLSSFFSIRLFSVHVVHPYSRIDMTIAWKKLRFILLNKFDFYITDNLCLC